MLSINDFFKGSHFDRESHENGGRRQNFLGPHDDRALDRAPGSGVNSRSEAYLLENATLRKPQMAGIYDRFTGRTKDVPPQQLQQQANAFNNAQRAEHGASNLVADRRAGVFIPAAGNFFP